MQSSAILAELVLMLALGGLVHSQDYRPNADCQSFEEQKGRVKTNCPAHSALPQRYFLPDYFSVELLPPNISWLNVETGVVASNFVPIPRREKLKRVSFSQFNQLPTDPRFPLNQLLVNVKQNVAILELNQVKLLQLNGEDLNGFVELTRLSLTQCNISSISAAVFSQLGPLPQMQLLSIVQNKDLRSLDWAFLAPLARSLQQIQLWRNGLRSLTASSSNFTLQQISVVNLEHNQLHHLPTAVYQTLATNASSQLMLSLEGNPLCGSNGRSPINCSCNCQFYFLKTWLDANPRVALRGVTCLAGDQTWPLTQMTFKDQTCEAVRASALHKCRANGWLVGLTLVSFVLVFVGP